MTKEELKLESINYLENFKDCANCRNRWGDCADQLDEYCLENGCCFATPKEQDIYLAGAEPREKRIKELEKDKQYFSDSLDKQIEATLKLQQENEELDCQKNRNKFCYSCANATERCFKNEIGCPCDKYKSYKDENAELKADNDARKYAMAMSEKVEKQLREQIEKMKCCNNCKFDNLEPPEVISNGVCENCINHSKWELQY